MVYFINYFLIQSQMCIGQRKNIKLMEIRKLQVSLPYFLLISYLLPITSVLL